MARRGNMKLAVLAAVGLLGATALGGCMDWSDPRVLTMADAIRYAEAQSEYVPGQPLMYVSGYQAGTSSGTAPGANSAWALGYADLESRTVTTFVVQTPGWGGDPTSSYSSSSPLTPGLMAVFSPLPAGLTSPGEALATAHAQVPGGVQPGMSANYFAAAPDGVLTWAIEVHNSTWSETVYVGPDGPTESPWPPQSFLEAKSQLHSGLETMGITGPLKIVGATGAERSEGWSGSVLTPFSYDFDATVLIPPDYDFADGLSPVWVFIVYLPDLAQQMHVAVYGGLPLAVSGPHPIGADLARAEEYALPANLIDSMDVAGNYGAKNGAVTMHLLPGPDEHPWMWAWAYHNPPYPSNGRPSSTPFFVYSDAKTGEWLP